MLGRRFRRVGRIPVLAAVVAATIALSSTVSTAQLPVLTPTPKPSKAPAPTATPRPATPSPTPGGVPSEVPIPTPAKTEGPDGKKTPKPSKTADGDKDKDDDLPDGLEDEFKIPSYARTAGRNTVRLVSILEPLASPSYPLEQVLIDGMGRFPVAGLAHYSDDWHNPRFTPEPHLHEGLDIFADFGTPIKAPDRGVITQLSEHGAGGIAVWMRSETNISYYFAHLLERVEDLRVGQRVETGTVLGFVGDSGNAKGGTPHLHFEIHPGGGEAIPPKPTVDAWLDEAEDLARTFVDARRALGKTQARVVAPSATTQTAKSSKEIEASMLLTLLDPVGGSVGMLPSLELRPRPGGAISDRLTAELIRQRVAGDVLLPSRSLDVRE